MNPFEVIKNTRRVNRLTEELFYAETVREIEAGLMRDGLWAKALADAKMDINAAETGYIKLRVRSLADEANIDATRVAQVEKERARSAARESAIEERRREIAVVRSGRAQSDPNSTGPIQKIFNVLLGGIFVVACGVSALLLIQWLVRP